MRLHHLAPLLFLIAYCAISVAPAFAQDTDKITLTNRDIRGEYVPAGSPAVLIPFVADPSAAGGDVFDTMCSDPAAIVTLILPNGTEVSVANAESLGFFYTVIQDGSFARSQILSPFSMPGTHTIIKLPALSPAGNYQIKVNGSSVAEDAVALTTYYSSSTVKKLRYLR